jgi:alcohol dehydrogenase class IV
VPRRLRVVGILESAVLKMVESAMKVTRLLVNKPRKMSLQDAIAIYA